MWRIALCLTLLPLASLAAPRALPLLPEAAIAALAQELSGEIAKRNLEGIARFHRQRGSLGFQSAAELVVERARAYGLSEVSILQFPADGKIFYGTQRSRPPWDAQFAELWEIKDRADTIRLASYDAEPVTLAQDSESADLEAALIDVGEGTKDSDYAGKEINGKLVLVRAQPAAVQDLAIGKFGAAGIVSAAQNQKTAWWGEDTNLIRWGHLDTFSPHKTFAFMVSLKTAQALRDRLEAGSEIRLHAIVKAGQHAGNYQVVTAVIPGVDPKLKEEEIVFSCHLDHQRPGANDNASGCVTILEVARTLQKLIGEKKLAPPARTIRFFWPPEIEGTVTLLNARPDLVKRIKAVVHMDMVGGGPVTKAVFHVTRGPMSLPSFVHDVAWAFAEFVNDESYRFAATGSADYPLFAPEGGKEPLLAENSVHSMGSDHDVYQDSSFKIPAIYLNDWPDRYIHTNFDSAANIDPTKLKRAAFIGAASGYVLANAMQPQPVERAIAHGRGMRKSQAEPLLWNLSEAEACNFKERQAVYEQGVLESTRGFLAQPLPDLSGDSTTHCGRPTDETAIYRRKREPKGPLMVFGYDYFADHAKAAGVAMPKLPARGHEYTYEALNFVDGTKSARQIRDALAAEYGSVPLEEVVDYLRALQAIGIVEQVTN